MGIDLSSYVVFKEVELWVDQGAGQYMRADAVLVKFDKDNLIEDVIILESKISGGTDFTVRQKQGWGKVSKEGKLTVKTDYNSGNFVLRREDKLNISPNQVKKVSDHGSANGGFTISDVDVSKFNKPKK